MECGTRHYQAEEQPGRLEIVDEDKRVASRHEVSIYCEKMLSVTNASLHLTILSVAGLE